MQTTQTSLASYEIVVVVFVTGLEYRFKFDGQLYQIPVAFLLTAIL